MKTALTFLLVALPFCSFPTDRFYEDLHVSSMSGRYRVDATSPDNAKEGYHPFQDDFTYRCVDTKTGDDVWTRKQPESEGSPASIMVSDSGATIVNTAYENIMVISPTGKVTRKIDFLNDALTDDENQNYVHQTTAGPMWAGLSISYFFEHKSREYYAIRPWWGRRVIVDLKNGEIQKTADKLSGACLAYEKEIVTKSLESKPKNDDEQFEQRLAIYLAGVLKMKKTIPYLRIAEESTVIGSSTSGGLSWGEDFDNEVDPHSYETFSIRQIAQLSLRRIGEKPKPLPCNSFEINEGGESKPFNPTLNRERHENVSNVKVGMSAKQILTLIGPPDYISYDKWSYDMDADRPFTLTIKMGARKSTAIKRQKPIWLNGLGRDEALAN